jgi:hypothetical protein
MFPKPVLASIDAASIVGIRAGSRPHKFRGIWAVVVGGRVFARSWDGAADGWFYTLLDEGKGTLQVGERELKIAARRARGERIMDAVDAAYKAKYKTPGALKYVRGFARPNRRARTVEIVPARSSSRSQNGAQR